MSTKTWLIDRFRNRNSFEKFIILNIPILLLLFCVDFFLAVDSDSWYGKVMEIWILGTGPLTLITLIIYAVLGPVFLLLALPFAFLVRVFSKKKEEPRKRRTLQQEKLVDLPEIKVDR